MTIQSVETIHTDDISVVTGVPDHLQDARPFAAVRLGNNRYFVANGETEDDLMYRPEDRQEWSLLSRNLEDGWQKVIAEILVHTRDAMQDYVRMHLINVSGEKSEADYLELDGYTFINLFVVNKKQN